MSTFYDKFSILRKKRQTLLCTGLDPDPQLIPSGYGKNASGTGEFLRDIIEATADITAAYKPNLAFFEVLGPEGMELFQSTVQFIRKKAPDTLIIADAKRGDIGSTATQYAKAFFETMDCDAVTLNPYMGMDTAEPFLRYRDKASIILCLTSNPGADQFERHGSPPLFEKIAAAAQIEHERSGNVWLVVGATKSSEDVKKVRSTAPDVPFLIPGVGAQGGDLESVLKASGPDCLINASRSILYAAKNKDEVKPKAAEEAKKLSGLMKNIIQF